MKSGFIWQYDLLFCPPEDARNQSFSTQDKNQGLFLPGAGWRGAPLSPPASPRDMSSPSSVPSLSPGGQPAPQTSPERTQISQARIFLLGKLLVFYQVLLHIEMISHFCILWSANFESLVRSSTGTWGHCFMVMRGAEGASVLVRLTCPRKSPTQTWWVRPSVAMAMSYNKTAVRNWNVVWWQRATRAPCSAVLRKAPHRRWHLLWDLAGDVWSLSALSHTCWFQSPIL